MSYLRRPLTFFPAVGVYPTYSQYQSEPDLEEDPPPDKGAHMVNTRAPTFDQYLHEAVYPRLTKGETKLNDALLARNQRITQSGSEFQAVSGVVAEVKQALEAIGALNAVPSVSMEEFRIVGSFKKGTMLNKSNVADMVIVFKTPPKHDDLVRLAERVVSTLHTRLPDFQFEVTKEEFGCQIKGPAVVRMLPALADSSAPLEEGVHMKRGFFQRNKQALKHAYWFDDNTKHVSVKMLVRLVKDIRRRSKSLAKLNAWTIETLSHYCVTNTFDGEPLPLSHAFRRFFALISAGILLHTSVSLTDPCDSNSRLNFNYSPAQADDICRAAQFVQRLILHERFDRLFALKDVQKDLCDENELEPGTLNIAPVRGAYVAEKVVNVPDPDKFSEDKYSYPDSQPAYVPTPPSSPRGAAVPPTTTGRPAPKPDEFNEFYRSIQVITSSRPVVNRTAARSMMRSAFYRPY